MMKKIKHIYSIIAIVFLGVACQNENEIMPRLEVYVRDKQDQITMEMAQEAEVLELLLSIDTQVLEAGPLPEDMVETLIIRVMDGEEQTKKITLYDSPLADEEWSGIEEIEDAVLYYKLPLGSLRRVYEIIGTYIFVCG